MIRPALLLFLASLPLTPVMANEAENIAIARTMIELINARNLDALDQVVAQDIVRHSAATAGITVTNLDEFRAFLESDFATVPDSVQTIDLVFADDEYVGIRAIYSGTQQGPMGPFPASGKKLTLPFIGILRIEQGKIAEMWVEWDNVYALTQLGHLKPPAAGTQQPH